MTAKLQTLPLKMDVKAFYDLVKHPPQSLLKDYPWLDLPKGASLEGYLAPATYRVLPDSTPEQLVRQMLDTFYTTRRARASRRPEVARALASTRS